MLLAGACCAVGGFLKEGVGSKGNSTGTSVVPIFFPFLKYTEHTWWCSPGVNSFLFIALIHFVLYGSSLGILWKESVVSFLEFE